MVGFWIFLIVLLICVTVVICFVVYNADGLDVWKIEKKIYQMDERIQMLVKVLEEAMEEGEPDE